MSSTKTAIVTGANKGIGLAIVRQLALQWPTSPFAASGSALTIYLTARSSTRGEEALKTLQSDPQLHDSKALKEQGGKSEIKYATLDISDDASIKSFVEDIKTKHPEGIDYVISNAGIAMTGFDEKVVKETLACNYFGTLQVMTSLLPLLRPHGRFVNVASMSGHLVSQPKYSSTIRQRFLSAKTPSDITSLMNDFTSAVSSGTHTSDWPSAAYAVSKCGLIGVTKVIAKEQQEKEEGKDVLVNVCCPGYVKTDMTKGGGHKTPDEGAQTPVMLAIGDIGGRSGGFWQHEKEIEW